MKHLRETFTDEEFTKLLAVKERFDENWHDFIMLLVEYADQIYYVFSGDDKEEAEARAMAMDEASEDRGED